MPITRVKICAITRAADAIAAAEAGAHAIGLVFHPASPRYLTIERAARIVSALPPFVPPVALFVDAAPRTIRQTCRQLGIRHVQLHGSESPMDVAELSEFTIVKAIKVVPATIEHELKLWRDAIGSMQLSNLRGILLDTPSATAAGGTGVANDWGLLYSLRQSGAFIELPPIIAAGGLRPETVGAVVTQLRPYAVDVSSGVEERAGEKCPQKIQSFMRAVRAAERQIED